MNQLSLLPVKLVDEQPADRSQSKDLLWLGFDEQDRRYALKTVEPTRPSLPLIEYFCYNMCALVGIAAPDWAVVTRLDGSFAFGSRWAEQATQFSPATHSDAELITWLDRTSADIAGMFALDAILPNHDRHLGNMLFERGGPRMRALAFDWSRTSLFEPWPWPADCMSAQTWRWLRSLGLADLSAARDKMARLEDVTKDQVYKIISAAPIEWWNNLDVDAAAEWWDKNRHSRAQGAMELLYK